MIEDRRAAEEALLGALLIEATAQGSLAIRHVQSLINHHDFYDYQLPDKKHARIFYAMTKCDHPDQVTVALKMNELGSLRPGDCAYLCHLVAECPNSLDYLYYAKAVRKYARGDEGAGYQGLKVA